MDQIFGTVLSVKDYIIEVEFLGDLKPNINHVLVMRGDPQVRMQVFKSAGKDRFYCIGLSKHEKLSRGTEVENTNAFLEIPVGNVLLGRVVNLFGEAVDGAGPLQPDAKSSIYPEDSLELEKFDDQIKVLETGIKVVDLFCPIISGGKAGLYGGSGVGKTVLLTEIMHNLLNKGKDNVSVFCGIGERTREGHELVKELGASGVLKDVSLIFGSMGENPGVRFLTAYAGVTIAEHFRDVLKKNVIFFADNVYRFVQAGNELSLLTRQIPSQDGYQATLTSEISTFHERLGSTKEVSLTSIETVYLPADDILDQGVQAISDYLDSSIVLSREVYMEGRYPAIDILSSNSKILNPESVSKDHYDVSLRARSLLKKSESLSRIVSLVGESELSEDDKVVYSRSRKLKNFMTQNFFVTANQSGKEGHYVPLERTVAGVKGILDGEYDSVSEDKFLFVGELDAKSLHS